MSEQQQQQEQQEQQKQKQQEQQKQQQHVMLWHCCLGELGHMLRGHPSSYNTLPA